MRTVEWIVATQLVFSVACASKPAGTPGPAATEAPPASSSAKPPAKAEPISAAPAEVLASDTPKTTTGGNTFIAPVGWSLVVRGPATILTPPEGDSYLAIVDVAAKDADEAVALAWAAYDATRKWPLKLATDRPDKDGWSKIRVYEYQTSPNEKRTATAATRFANDMWTVSIYDMPDAVGEKRGAQVGLVFGRLLPKGMARESFAGKPAKKLDKARIAELKKFVETSQKALGVPGVSVGIVEKGKVVFAGGFGVREIGKPAKVDADTRYIIASNTKGLTTLMLAKLVDEKKLTWDTPVTSVLPSFKLGDADTTSKVLVKHLICACTGLPRQDMEWLFEFKNATPESSMATLATMQPTSKFGELFQYSNLMAAAGGFTGGHVAFPKLELGKAYDDAMRSRVFGPLGMKATTLDFARAQKGNFAIPHAPDITGKTALASYTVNNAVIPVRPAGGAWSTVNDMLKYVEMELAEGKLPNGKTYIQKDALLARRDAQVALNSDATYGMGLMVDKTYGVTVVHHGGDMIGFHSDMMWLPEYGVGAVVLTNGDPGWFIRTIFQRKLLEVLFDGRAEADAQVAAAGKAFFEQRENERKRLTIPADAQEAQKLASRYASAPLGELTVIHEGGKTIFDVGEWKSEMGSRKNPDGTISYITLAPGIIGLEFVVGSEANRTLVLRDAQHEYVFAESSLAN